MRGTVDNAGRALITVEFEAVVGTLAASLAVWIDTGFTGELVLPQSVIKRFGLQKFGSVDAVLADGSQTELSAYSCMIHWFGSKRNLEVIANDGEYPLLGVGLLLGMELRIDYQNLKLMLAPVA